MSSATSSPSRSAMALVPSSESEWQPILHSSNQVVLYNPQSHALTIGQRSSLPPESSVIATRRTQPTCPYCKQHLPTLTTGPESPLEDVEDDIFEDFEDFHDDDPAYDSRAANYFQLLAISNETNSRPSSPPGVLGGEGSGSPSSSTFLAEQMAEGYFQRFFQEEYKLGMGANGSVYLCQHMLDGNPLGHFAVKKIAVGESHSYLLKILREVRLLEQLHHPNIVIYHHAWLETSQFSSFGPRIPTLHVLMQWAEGGSLDDYIDIRQGKKPSHPHIHPLPHHNATSRFEPGESVTDLGMENSPAVNPSISGEPEATHGRSARIKAFRAFQRANPEERERMLRDGYGGPDRPPPGKRNTEWKSIHLLSAEEIKSLFQDIVEGLGFLHSKSILHLDLKPGNVLLTWDDGRMIPRAMLSDFGTSRDMINSGRIPRSGNTGTLEYASPESLPSPETGLLQQIDSKSDMWSLGMILHKMLFFRLPYRYASESDANGEPTSLGQGHESEKMQRLEDEVLSYPGFKAAANVITSFEARRLPRSYLVLLESLLSRSPLGRTPCDRVVQAVREGKLDPLREVPRRRSPSKTPDALIPIPRAPSRPTDVGIETDGQRTPTSNSERGRLLSLSPSPTFELAGDKVAGTANPNEAMHLGMPARNRGGVWPRLSEVMSSRRGKLAARVIRSFILVLKVCKMSVFRGCWLIL
ncbi:other/IKS protein kinase [Coprinopsis sp. MPI-PUGE-AT-0042]|nr:other/IKS protein kinase [Coprinopsis sp. MPI-PUGE-AT-0042]